MKKLNFSQIGERLNKAEMKKIMAGSGEGCPATCKSDSDCGSGCGRCWNFNGKNYNECVAW